MPPCTWMLVARDEHEGLRAIGLRQSEIRDASPAISASNGRGDVAGRRHRRLGLQQHVGAHVLDGLEAADRPAELEPGLGVVGAPSRIARIARAGLLAEQRHRRAVQRRGRMRRRRLPDVPTSAGRSVGEPDSRHSLRDGSTVVSVST